MRYSEQTLFPAMTGENSLFEALRRRIRNWHARREVQSLAEFDERMLSDMGISHDDVIWASKLPLNVDSAHEMDKVSRARRHSSSSRPTFRS